MTQEQGPGIEMPTEPDFYVHPGSECLLELFSFFQDWNLGCYNPIFHILSPYSSSLLNLLEFRLLKKG